MRDQIIKIINDNIKKNKLTVALNNQTLDKPFKELGIDSILAIQIIVEIEDKLGLKLNDVNLKTINELIAAFETANKK